MTQIDSALKKWIKKLGESWGLPIQDVVLTIAADEIENRIENYPPIRESLSKLPFDIKQFADNVRSCWVMGGRFDSVRFNAFIRNEEKASGAINQLVNEFPESDARSIDRINNFLQTAVKIGFNTPKGGSDFAGAAQFASLILTSLLPHRFVDYRKSRWEIFSKAFGYTLPFAEATHGEWMVWAGRFAQKIAETSIYKEYWPISENKLSNPSWVISGLCWVGLEPSRPISDPVDPNSMSFPEGSEKRRLHLFRERNRFVVALAKELAMKDDPLLQCQVCNFSFSERYGDLGKEFIEAHHKIPVAQLKKGSRTKVGDIALICSNCHRMIHKGNRTLSIEELKKLINVKK